jgi:signal transduction histidine kinase
MVTEDAMSRDFLRRTPIFAALPDGDLDRLLETAESVSVKTGELLMAEGSPGGSLYVVLDGEFEVTKRSGDRDIVIAICGQGEILGEISLLDRSPRTASVRASRDSHVLMISQSAFQEFLIANPPAIIAILQIVTARLRSTESMLRQSQKMAALGTLAAGLAHELNNPAAAAQRGSAHLRDAIAEWLRLTRELQAANLDARQQQLLDALRVEFLDRPTSPILLDPLARGDREYEVQAWLEERGVDEAWELAPALVGAGWDLPAVERVAASFGSEYLLSVVRWLGAGAAIFALLSEVGESVERISEIVKAVKTYSYLDQAPIQNVDVHEGLENTLVILRHKLKAGVRVTRDYAADLPRIEAFGSELNQAWTNIIDNAVDAMQGQGELRLRTSRSGANVLVEIGDSGPGIPPEIQERIFEPFFTTKPPGIGTGLGLHITYNTIVQKHRGQIRIVSQPGETTFQIELPIRLKSSS